MIGILVVCRRRPLNEHNSTSMALEQATALVPALEADIDAGKFDAAHNTLRKLKLLIVQLPSLPPNCTNTSTAAQEHAVAQATLEHAVLLSVKMKDSAAFERDLAQLKPLYYDTRHTTPSESRCLVLGMGLMHLLVDNRLAEFHSELELASDTDRADAHVQFVVALEQSLMEGNYSKVLLARSSAPTHFTWFMDQMVDSIRDNIADVTESAYQSITLADAQRLLHFDSAAALGSYIDEERPKWAVEGDRIMFEQAAQRVGCKDIPSVQLIRESLLYATELDRIV